MTSPRPTRLILCLLATAVLSACATSREWDRQVGAQHAQEIETSMGLVANPALESYVQGIGHELADQLNKSPFTYRFKLIDDSAPNAFALPGGYIYVTRGLLPLLNDADELANVLGHEIIHAEARHAARQQKRAVLPSLLALPGHTVGLVAPRVGQVLASPFDAVGGVYLAAHSRDAERQADNRGQRLAAAAGYDPAAMSRFLSQLQAYENVLGQQRTKTLLDTHPLTPQRIDATRSTAASLNHTPRDTTIPSNRQHFLNRLDGLIIGDNPDHGIFNGRQFLHPTLGFTLTLPLGWQTFNNPQAMGAISPEQDAWILTTAAAPEFALPADAAQNARQILSQQNITPLIDQAFTTATGLPAHRLRVSAGDNGQKQPMVLELTWITCRGRLYRQTALGRIPQTNMTQATANSFAPISGNQIRSITVQRLRITTTGPNETLQTVAQRVNHHGPVKLMEAYNAVPANAVLPNDYPLKYIASEPYIK